jgi:cyclic-di-AMP phosphodiesterase PgpH
MKAAEPGAPRRRNTPVPDKEQPTAKISLIFGLERLRGRWPRGQSRKPPAPPRDQRPLKLGLLLVLSLSLTFILAPRSATTFRHYRVGDIARENVKATGEFLVEDVETTAQRKKEVLARIPPVFDLDEQVADKAQARLQKAMSYMRRVIQDDTAAIAQTPAGGGRRQHKPVLSYKLLMEHKADFDRLLGVSLPNPTYQLLAKMDFSPYLEAATSQILAQFFSQGVISARTVLQPLPRQILLRRLPSKKESLERPPFSFVQLDEGRRSAATYCREMATDFSPAERWLVCDLAQYLLTANVTPDVAETQARQKAALKELQPTFFKVKRGEMLIREGEPITALHLVKLEAQRKLYPRSRTILIFLGIFLSLALLMAVFYQLACLSLRNFSRRLRDLTFLAVLLLAGALLNRSLLVLGEHLTANLPTVGLNLVYFLPLGLPAIFAAMFLGLETGVGVAFLSATFTALMVEKPFPLFIYFVITGLVAVWGVRNCRRHHALIKAGLAISLVNMCLLAAFKLLDYPFAFKDLLRGEIFAFAGGAFTGILALGFTPVMEMCFRYSSNIRLLELLNLDQPILRELMLVAPGTYHHSLVVGQMVEAAAETIGANPALAKAAAYYHDIGKVKKPIYFVENQIGENKHEKLAPSMSGLILISHVKDGVDLAQKNQLGEAIVDIIRQHHGTGFIRYFYHKAQTQADNPQTVKIEDFRYPGPRPQTKEAGLVMLADQVEAASRTLAEPTSARIQGLVQKIINNVFADGQLDECELTLKDLHHIAKSFNKILGGIFHQRIHYPQPADKKKNNEDLDKQPPKKNGHKSGENQEKSREDLKRLGLV